MKAEKEKGKKEMQEKQKVYGERVTQGEFFFPPEKKPFSLLRPINSQQTGHGWVHEAFSTMFEINSSVR